MKFWSWIPRVRDRHAPVHSAVEELSLAPPLFSGASRVDADAWLHRFIQYVEYKRLGNEQKLQRFKLLMNDAAADWLHALPDKATRDLREVVRKFNDRFVANAACKNANVAALWNRRQRPGETAEEYVGWFNSWRTEKTIDGPFQC